ncbi:PRC and DUF2382 domain-containing protein [uncultured Nocardioides sp.]|uniref:DUF2382 domain-containing protein n=1 Tax=uncultured Nocardioides sp. TaxID=198441 RepID=A0A6J4N5E3_9ACTN|nr:PRC and DUF2382 domain-containing protein [uncultured Nocardioides sp.]CAA9378514.1 MAG: hypothetical protein AVDCRST_MAG06-753 [uncultured Nocardioides sp.]
MLSTDQAQTLLTGGGNVVDSQGDKIGGIGQIFLDDQSGQPEWVTAKTGLFGTGESFVPLRDAEVSGNDLRVPYDKEKVKDAPRISDPEGHLDEAEEDRLYTYYGVTGYSGTTGDAGYAATTGTGTVGTGTADRSADLGTTGTSNVEGDISGPETDSAMTRSEEQLHVGTERHATGRARLRKYIVTENVTKTVPVSREEVRLEREPITEANRGDALDGPDLSTEEHDVVLNEERVVVDKETVPVERVRVDKDTVTEEQRVDETVRKEEVELDQSGVTDDGRTRG